MVDPCDRYSAHVVTEGGLTPQDPTGLVSSVYDYQEWQRLASKFLQLLSDAIDRHQDHLGASDWPLKYGALKTRLDDLPGIYEIFGVPAAPGADDADLFAMRDIAVEAACRLGEVEADVEAGGGEPDIPLGKAPDPRGDLEKAGDKVLKGVEKLAVFYLVYKLLEGRK